MCDEDVISDDGMIDDMTVTTMHVMCDNMMG